MNNEDALLEALNAHGGSDVVISYKDIANLFPSSDPHPDSFDYKSINDSLLMKWAAKQGWEVSKVSDQAPMNAKHSPPIRFKKVDKNA